MLPLRLLFIEPEVTVPQSRPVAWLAYIGLALILLSPLFFSGSVIFPFVVPKATAIHLGITLVSMAAALHVWQANHSIRFSYLSIVLILYVVANVLTAMLGINPSQSFWSTFERSQGTLGLAFNILLCFSVAGLFTSELNWRWVFRSIVFSAGLIGLIAFAFVIGLYDVSYFYRDFGRLAFTVGNAAIFGHYLAVLSVLALTLCLVDYKIVGKKLLLWEVATFICLLLCLVASGTRGGMLALIITAPMLLMISPIPKKIKFGVAGFGTLVLGSSLLFMWDIVQTRVAETTLDNQSIAYRIDAWQIGWQAILERPWLGWGSENFISVFGLFSSATQIPKETFDTAHNHLVAITTGSGFLGLSLYFLILSLALFQIVLGVRDTDPIRKGNALLVAAIITSYQIASIFIFETIIAQPIFYIAVAYCLSSSRHLLKSKPSINFLVTSATAIILLLVVAHEVRVWNSATQLRIVEGAPNWDAKVQAAKQDSGNFRQQELLYLFSMETSQHWMELSIQEKSEVRRVLDQLLIDSKIETLNWRTTFHLANAYLRMVSDYPDLSEHLRLLVDRTYQLAPGRPQSNQLLANYFIITNREDRARAVLQDYLKKNPDRPIMQTMLKQLTP